MKKMSGISLNIVVVLTFLVGLISTFHNKQLVRDGSIWAYRMIATTSWVNDAPFFRFTSLIIQTPAVLMAKLHGEPQLINWLFCFSYFVYPFLALFFLRFYLVKKEKTELLYPLVLSLFLTVIPNWAFATSLVPEVTVLGWILFCYIICEEKPDIKVLSLIGILIFFSYELGAAFIVLAMWILQREKKLNRQSMVLFCFLIVLQILNVLFIIMPGMGHKYFVSSIPNGFQSPVWALIMYVLVALPVMAFNNRAEKTLLFFGTTLSVFVTYLLITSTPYVLWMFSYNNRTWSVPVCFVLLLVFYEVWKRKNVFKNVSFSLLVLLMIVPGLVYETILVIDSQKISQRILHFMENKQGCVALKPEDKKLLEQDSYLPQGDLTFFSILIQNKRKLGVILFNDPFSDEINLECRPSEEWKRLEASLNGYKYFIEYDDYDLTDVIQGNR